MGSKAKSLADHLATVPDPRKIRGQRHVLLDIIIIAILGTLSSVDDWEGIEEFAKDQEAWLRTFLELPHGIPSHDTFNRVFRLLDPAPFTEAFLGWVKGVRDKVPGDVVAIDGKTLRSSMAEGKPALHVVSAWSTANHLVLGQRSVDVKSNEITAIPEILKVLELKGCIVTIDAMGCQKDIARAIVARKADYVLAVKGNQESLHKAVLDINPAQPPWSVQFPEMTSLLESHPELPLRTKFERNLVVMKSGEPFQLKMSKARQTDTNLFWAQNNFITATDPGFEDEAKGNFALKPEAVAFRKISGFEPIPFEKIGLQKDEYRQTLPTQAEIGRPTAMPPVKEGDKNFGTQ